MGKIGVGKSLIGNSIFGKKVFNFSFVVKFIIKFSEKGSSMWYGKIIVVVDTFGVFDIEV